MRAFNEKLIAEFRANQGELSGQLKGSQLLLLTTTGRKSGKLHTTVIGYRRKGDRYAAIASNNGNDAAPAWYANVLANPVAAVEVGAERFQVRARTAQGAERAELAALIEYLPSQQALTKREIPIVVFERI
jgi:deazaflavin-dependent oxidoreductase (nitroreductase family)